jgi:hypothetical protein
MNRYPNSSIAGVDIECGVNQMGIVPNSSGQGIGVPLVEGLPPTATPSLGPPAGPRPSSRRHPYHPDHRAQHRCPTHAYGWISPETCSAKVFAAQSVMSQKDRRTLLSIAAWRPIAVSASSSVPGMHPRTRRGGADTVLGRRGVRWRYGSWNRPGGHPRERHRPDGATLTLSKSHADDPYLQVSTHRRHAQHLHVKCARSSLLCPPTGGPAVRMHEPGLLDRVAHIGTRLSMPRFEDRTPVTIKDVSVIGCVVARDSRRAA